MNNVSSPSIIDWKKNTKKLDAFLSSIDALESLNPSLQNEFIFNVRRLWDNSGNPLKIYPTETDIQNFQLKKKDGSEWTNTLETKTMFEKHNQWENWKKYFQNVHSLNQRHMTDISWQSHTKFFKQELLQILSNQRYSSYVKKFKIGEVMLTSSIVENLEVPKIIKSSQDFFMSSNKESLASFHSLIFNERNVDELLTLALLSYAEPTSLSDTTVLWNYDSTNLNAENYSYAIQLVWKSVSRAIFHDKTSIELFDKYSCKKEIDMLLKYFPLGDNPKRIPLDAFCTLHLILASSQLYLAVHMKNQSKAKDILKYIEKHLKLLPWLDQTKTQNTFFYTNWPAYMPPMYRNNFLKFGQSVEPTSTLTIKSKALYKAANNLPNIRFKTSNLWDAIMKNQVNISFKDFNDLLQTFLKI